MLQDVCSLVCLTVTLRHCVKTAKHIEEILSMSSNHIILIFRNSDSSCSTGVRYMCDKQIEIFVKVSRGVSR